MAEIGWIDFSTADRKRMHRALLAIRPEGQLDELGIGSIRDELADQLFPGLSTIQTRAKYFFIVPYILRDFYYLPAKERRKTTATNYLEDCEHDIKNRLRETYAGKRNTGVIGVTLPPARRIVRQPSEIYWVGLNIFGCVQTKGLTLPAFLKNLDQHNKSYLGTKKEKEEDDDPDAGLDSQENPVQVPAVASGWKEHVDMPLTFEEADFLRYRFLHPTHPKLVKTVLHELFQHEELCTALIGSKKFGEFACRAVQIPGLSAELRARITRAHDFAIVIDGAHILYNHLLQQHLFPNDYDGGFLDEWRAWHNRFSDQMIDFAGYRPDALSSRSSESLAFVTRWWQLINDGDPGSFKKLEQLIYARETAVKGRKARLRGTANSFSEVKLKKWLGLKLLQYRFFQARQIAYDILNPNQHAG